MLQIMKQENVKKNWLERNAESMELTVEESDSEEETVEGLKQKITSLHLKKLQKACFLLLTSDMLFLVYILLLHAVSCVYLSWWVIPASTLDHFFPMQDLNDLLARPFQPKTFSRRYLAGSGVSHLLQKQLEQLAKRKSAENMHSKEKKRSEFVVIGQDCVELLEALRSSGHEVCVSVDKTREMRRAADNLKRKRREEKKKSREQHRKERKRAKEGM